MTLEEAKADAKATFPLFPEELFELWLFDRIRENGWPPEGIEWQGFFFGLPISVWQSLSWQKQSLTLDPDQLSPTAFNIIGQVVGAAAGEKNLMASYIPNTGERMRGVLPFIKQNGTIPGTPILLARPHGIEIVDGNHRISALLAYQALKGGGQPSNPLPFEAWVASCSV